METPSSPVEFENAVLVAKPVFWRRLGAFAVDYLFLAVIGFTLVSVVGPKLSTLGNYARLVGLPVIFLYFGYAQSRYSTGQTLAQKLFKLQVVDRNGELISLRRSLIRCAILWSPALFNHLVVPVTSPVFYLLGIPLLLSFIGLPYFFIANRATRQSIHDLLCGSYVVPVSPSVVIPHAPISPWLYRGYAGILGILIVGMLLVFHQYASFFRPLLATAKAIDQIEGGTVTKVVILNFSNGEKALAVTIEPKGDYPVAVLAEQAGKVALRTYPNWEGISNMVVIVEVSTNILLYRSTEQMIWYKPPQAWNNDLEEFPMVRKVTINYF